MTFDELIKNRQSDRKYKDALVSRSLIEQCVEAARLAPSACNSQPWKFIIVDNKETKDLVAKETYSNLISFNKFTEEAPVLIVLVVEKPKLLAQIGGRLKDRDYFLYDIGIVAEHFCLKAAEIGLGTCMLGWFNEKQLKKILNIPKSRSVGLVITLGYSNEEKIRDKKRKNLDEIMSYNKY